MFQYLLVLLLALPGAPAKPKPEDDVAGAIAHAEALYYGARFKESVDLLSRIDDLIKPETGSTAQKIDIKLYLALAHIGLNEMPQAQAALRDLFVLDPNYRLDPDQFSPKVIEIAGAARGEANAIRCRKVQDDAQQMLAAGDPTAIMNLISPMLSQCPALAQMEPGVADLFYRRGADLYKRGELPGALQNFRQAAALAPDNQLAREYMDLTQGKLQVQGDRLILSWREHFDANAMALAAQDYRALVANDNPGTKKTIADIRSEYRKNLNGRLDAWRQACAKGDSAAMSTIRRQASDMLPDPAIGQDILQQMDACVPAGCIEMTAPLALARVKTRVNPEIPASFRRTIQDAVTIRVKARISETGDVSVSGAEGGNSGLQKIVGEAVGQWKFTPIMDKNGPRCVDTEIPFVIKP